MARIRAILAALWTASRRNQKSFGSFAGNNIAYLGFTLLFFSDTGAFIFSLVIVGLILFFPLCTDPLRAIPADRLSIWPLANRDRRLLRILSPWLNPLTWVLAVLLVWKKITIGLWLLILGLFLAGFVWPTARFSHVLRALPAVPGPLGQLIRKNLREMTATLDFYAGLILAVPALFFRLNGSLPRDAFLPLTLVILLTISTYAQCLLGLDGAGGWTRYRLLPLASWKILAAKDVTFLFVAILFTLPLSPVAGLAAALMGLAVGHRASVTQLQTQARWRFQSTGSLGASLTQMVLMILAGTAVAYKSSLALLPCAAIYVCSTWWFGRVLDAEEYS